MENITQQGKIKKKNLIFIIISIIIMISVVCWFFYHSVSNMYFTTDNSKITATLYTISSTSPGKIVKFTKSEGDSVRANEIIGRVEGGSYLKSPVNGEIMTCYVNIGQSVSGGSPIAIIADTDEVCIKANIEETDIVKIQEGQNVLISLDAYPKEKFTGYVESVDKVTQAALTGMATSFTTSGTYTKVTQLIPVKIVINEDIDLKNIIGTNATVKIKIK